MEITTTNLSILKAGKAKTIRFSTLNKTCKIIDCQPVDKLENNRPSEYYGDVMVNAYNALK